MKKLSLQWRITLMTTVLICITCVLMNCLIGYSGKRYMDSIGNGISAYSEIDKGKPSSFNPEMKIPTVSLPLLSVVHKIHSILLIGT